MTGFAVASVLQFCLAASPGHSYTDAHRETTETGRPMVVMVGAEWCAACKVMEGSVIPKVQQRGLLRRVAFAVVDVDRQRELGRQLTRGGPIPQLLMFRRTASGWRLSRLVGRHDVRAVEQFIDEGLKRDEQARQEG